MTSQHRVSGCINECGQGDVEKYFDSLSNVIENNSGVNDFKIITSDCYSQSCPLFSDSYTKVHLTESSCDIIDISKGYVNMNLSMDVTVEFTGISAVTSPEENDFNNTYFFIGFKSGSHIINVYNVWVNGRATACKNTKAKYEQTITYSQKVKEEKAGRPGLYSNHKLVQQMSKCVCGTYFSVPVNTNSVKKSQTKNITMEVCFQVDDLLPFSVLNYYPTFLSGDIELEFSPNLIQNMVFCPIPIDVALEHEMYDFSKVGAELYHKNLNKVKQNTDYRFTQCGDWAKISILFVDQSGSSSDNVKTGSVKLTTNNLKIDTIKSYVHGFNIKNECRNQLLSKFSNENLIVPAQWAEWYSLSQVPTSTQIKANIQVPMNNVSQINFTFPNTSNQLTVTRNPHLEAIQCHVMDRIVPDKFFTTLDNAHSEMILNAMGCDSLFTAPRSVIEALTTNRGKYNSNTLCKRDDSDYTLIINLERYGSGCFCDGMNGLNVPVALDANFINGTENPHYYSLEPTNLTDKEFNPHNINMIVISDSFWVFGKGGAEFVK